MTMRSSYSTCSGSRTFAALMLVAGALLLAEPAAAFRCGSKLVVDGMHEQQVIAICGEPTTRRNLGYALRPYDFSRRRHLGGGWSRRFDPGFSGYVEEVVITEFTYNFGPRKLMQRLVFEGGMLVEIETIGYGY